MEEKNKKTKKHIRIKGLLVVILLVYLLGSFIYYLWKIPIKNIRIENNHYYKENYLINYLNLENTSILKANRFIIVKKLKKLDLIKNAKVRKNYLGKLTIIIEEDKALFYNWNNKKVILSSGKEIEYKKELLGIPTLINYVKDDVYEELINKLSKVSPEIISLVSEIEYNPSIINEKVVDEKRFIFRMNDGNVVYINTLNIEKINNYISIYEGIVNKNGSVSGCLYLDSNSENNYFNKCNDVTKEEVKEDGEKELR
jgi:cell division septal protein FtsQ